MSKDHDAREKLYEEIIDGFSLTAINPADDDHADVATKLLKHLLATDPSFRQRLRDAIEREFAIERARILYGKPMKKVTWKPADE